MRAEGGHVGWSEGLGVARDERETFRVFNGLDRKVYV
jgi:hypothetical protein